VSLHGTSMVHPPASWVVRRRPVARPIVPLTSQNGSGEFRSIRAEGVRDVETVGSKSRLPTRSEALSVIHRGPQTTHRTHRLWSVSAATGPSRGAGGRFGGRAEWSSPAGPRGPSSVPDRRSTTNRLPGENSRSYAPGSAWGAARPHSRRRRAGPQDRRTPRRSRSIPP
jgi:hypothetical protein